MHSDDPVAPVGYLRPTAFHVEPKRPPEPSPWGSVPQSPGACLSPGPFGRVSAPMMELSAGSGGGGAAGAASAGGAGGPRLSSGQHAMALPASAVAAGAAAAGCGGAGPSGGGHSGEGWPAEKGAAGRSGHSPAAASSGQAAGPGSGPGSGSGARASAGVVRSNTSSRPSSQEGPGGAGSSSADGGHGQGQQPPPSPSSLAAGLSPFSARGEMVITVPETWQPGKPAVQHRSSFERVPGCFDVTIQGRMGAEYMQVGCWQQAILGWGCMCMCVIGYE